MRFNPIKRILYTEKGELIKKLDCPYKVTFAETLTDAPADGQICSICNGEIVDTKTYGEKDLLQLISNGSHVCFKVDATQPNVKIVYIS